MLRISESRIDGAGTLFKLEGKLVAPWTRLLETICIAAVQKPVIVDLANMAAASSEGLTLLRRLEERGCHCIGWPPHLREQLHLLEYAPNTIR